MSLIETVVALCVFSISIAVISSQIQFDMSGINNTKNNIAEIYHRGL